MQLLDLLVQKILHLVDILLRFGRDEERFRAEFRHPSGFQLV